MGISFEQAESEYFKHYDPYDYDENNCKDCHDLKDFCICEESEDE